MYPVTMSETTPPSDVAVDDVFELLSDERRRLVLEHLLRRPSPVSVPEVVDHLVTAELNGHDQAEELSSRIAVSLHHIHLPKLAAADLIDYDRERREVTLRESATAVEPHLALTSDDHPGLLDLAD